MKERKAGFLSVFLSSFFIRNFLITEILDALRVMLNFVIVLFGGTPSLAGEKRFYSQLIRLLCKYREPLFIKDRGIYIQGKRVQKIHKKLSIFIPLEGFSVSPGEEERLHEILTEKLYSNNRKITREFYRATAVYWVAMVLSLGANVMIIYHYLQRSGGFSGFEKGITIFWIVSNIFLFFQMVIYHKTRLRSIALYHNFQEATEEEEGTFLTQGDVPGALILVPAYNEEAELLRRSLLCHMLQKYTNKQIVLLLGNEYYDPKESVARNTEEVTAVVEGLNWYFTEKEAAVHDILNSGRSLNSVIPSIYREMSLWVTDLAMEIQNSPVKYPTDNYVVDNSLLVLKEYFSQRASLAESMTAADLKKEADVVTGIFTCRIKIFMRTRYDNLEQEKTKAGNLTAYLPFINREIVETCDEKSGLPSLIPGEEHNRYKYISIFDCDTIARPGYLLRKIIYLEREDTQDVGLIQSPYVVPAPEPSATGSASGVQSYWFLPTSLGLTTYKSAFWLGFNSCWRYETLKQIPDFLAETVIEDVEVSLKILETGQKIVTSPEQQCTTYSPNDLRGVQVQRTRWASGGLRIVKIYLASLFRKKLSVHNFMELFLRTNYIANLNLLPVFITLLFILQTPLHYICLPYVAIQYVNYLLIYFVISTRKTNYSVRNIYDGLAISFFMNFFYLRGLAYSIKVLIKRDRNQVFNATPRSADLVINNPTQVKTLKKKKEFQIDAFEIIGILFLLTLLVGAAINNIRFGHYYDLFVPYQLICVVYSIFRFVGLKHFCEATLHNLFVRPVKSLFRK